MNKIAPIRNHQSLQEESVYYPYNGQKPVLLSCAATLCHSALCLTVSVANT